MKYFLFFFGLTLICRRGWTFILADKRIFYQNCEIFNNVDLYDGPVCGSDGITYANGLYLDCVNYQTFQNDITVALSGPCKVMDRCYSYKTLSYGSNPVCANNGLTYGNEAQVNCLRQINVDLKILHNGSCTVREVYDIYDSVEKICDIANSRFEWNPVCASDGVTYHNPFKFLCYKARDLKTLLSDNECQKNTQLSCAHLKSSAKTFGAKDEVCGNDGVTYKSIHHLQCHNNQNKCQCCLGKTLFS
ncbi:serine protease inhibitor dipetalogastin-like isoform X2 [Bombus pyrosoma]|uniref:serine protease inhibitor dipetalogastin-like isoform X2 n=1 Tax=Bombus pyrosoma TaxID=396416 RepID=UPI001CB9A4DA|nr:serine protease inhibitor dipetalogastin-like isoform X2 [Bombus pyrosoma]